MKKSELFELIKKHSINYTSEWILRDAVEAYSSASNGEKPVISGPSPLTEDEVLHYFYHIGAADALAKSMSHNAGKPDFDKRLNEFKDVYGSNNH